MSFPTRRSPRIAKATRARTARATQEAIDEVNCFIEQEDREEKERAMARVAEHRAIIAEERRRADIAMAELPYWWPGLDFPAGSSPATGNGATWANVMDIVPESDRHNFNDSTAMFECISTGTQTENTGNMFPVFDYSGQDFELCFDDDY